MKRLPQLDLIERINAYRSKIAEGDIAPELKGVALVEQAKRILSESDSLLDHCLCHNDLLASNILVNDGIHFFDWEFSGVTSPFFELAVICRGNQLDAQQQKNVLRGYFGEYWSSHERLFKRWIWLYDYISLLWEIAVQKDAESVSEEQQQRLEALLQN